MTMFRKGDRVAYLYGGTGTVTSKRGNVVRVLWDDGFETPVHVLEICHVADAERYGFPSQKENDRSISDQESAAAPTEPLEKETIISKLIFHPGSRVNVRHDDGSTRPATVVRSHGFTYRAECAAVHYDGYDISLRQVHRSRLEPLPPNLRVELIKLGASPETTASELAAWSVALGASPSEIFAEYQSLGFVAEVGLAIG